MERSTSFDKRNSALEMSPDAFRRAGHDLIDRIADFLETLPQRPVTTGEQPSRIRTLLGQEALPEAGRAASELLERAANLLFDHSLFNGHPRFLGYITASGAPIGALGELLATAVNPNVGAFALSPMATEIEKQTVRWIAELIDYPADCGGLFVSGGTMANFVGYLAGRRAKATWPIRQKGLRKQPPLTVYCSGQTHTWLQKAADQYGQGTDSIRWIKTDDNQRMDVEELERQIRMDLDWGFQPFLVVGTAGTVSTGAVDPLAAIADVCRRYDLWFHVDGAYGAPAAALPENAELFQGLREADSLALDPHKWLYSPLEAGCVLVRDPQDLVEAFHFHPEYYNFDGEVEDPATNFHEYGPQNSRGFRALKVWLGLQQAGRQGYIQMMRDDIALAKALYRVVGTYPELEALSHHLSITTFRFVPDGMSGDDPAEKTYLDNLNAELLNRLQRGGEVFVSNAIIEGVYCLRACVVNFRTTMAEMEALPELVRRVGRQIDAERRCDLKKSYSLSH
jgi:aromatic-L-amino-acid decarboxylase